MRETKMKAILEKQTEPGIWVSCDQDVPKNVLICTKRAIGMDSWVFWDALVNIYIKNEVAGTFRVTCRKCSKIAYKEFSIIDNKCFYKSWIA